jgi:hypothetical protein
MLCFPQTLYLPSFQKTGVSRPEIADRARELVARHTEYQSRKAESDLFDRAGRRWNLLTGDYKILLHDLKESDKDSIEDFAQEISELLPVDSIPSWSDLGKAYELTNARGHVDAWISDQLLRQPNSDEARIEVADRIELFASKTVK